MVDGDWHEAAPRPAMSASDFAVRWSGTLRPAVSGTYRVGVIGTMKAAIFLDDSAVVRTVYPSRDGEFPDPRLAQSVPLQLEAGRSYRIRVEAEALAAARQADAVVLFLGLTARLEGEEMPVQIEGFRGGDRTRLDLPAPQQRLLERVVAVGKPTVLVLLNGSALAVNWAQGRVPAILEAWYPGQAGGTAIAEVLFGDYNPGGRLPVTFYRDVSDLPPFESYDMRAGQGRTYRFFKGRPLYPFGHGLSYTTFAYRNLRASAESLSGADTLTVSVDVTNSGTRAGDEVVQLYVQHQGSAVERPVRELRGYRRISLRPGETRTVTLPLPASALAYWSAEQHRWIVESEPVRIQVGASAADIRAETTVRVTGGR